MPGSPWKCEECDTRWSDVTGLCFLCGEPGSSRIQSLVNGRGQTITYVEGEPDEPEF